VALDALAKFGAPGGRGETTRLGPADKPLILVDESYNANLASMAAAMEVYAALKPEGGSKVLVLGDMLELGPRGPQLHASLKEKLIATGATKIFLVGPSMASLAAALPDDAVVSHAGTIEEIGETILSSLAHGDAVMVKGSKGVRLAGLVQAIRDRFS
jgi:UDP-N-acetylmuramoyl-tripeptide--D-alanyl-D-alanine ligase